MPAVEDGGGGAFQATFLAAVPGRVSVGRRRGLATNPRRVGLAGKADVWLRVRPGTDGALALGLAHVMIERGWYDRDFILRWSNGPHLVRADTGRLMTARDIEPGCAGDGLLAWDAAARRLVRYDTATGRYDGDVAGLSLHGEVRVPTPAGDCSMISKPPARANDGTSNDRMRIDFLMGMTATLPTTR